MKADKLRKYVKLFKKYTIKSEIPKIEAATKVSEKIFFNAQSGQSSPQQSWGKIKNKMQTSTKTKQMLRNNAVERNAFFTIICTFFFSRLFEYYSTLIL